MKAYSKKIKFMYLDKRTGEKYENLLEAQQKLGMLGYIEAVEGGNLVKVCCSTADEVAKKIRKKKSDQDSIFVKY